MSYESSYIGSKKKHLYRTVSLTEVTRTDLTDTVHSSVESVEANVEPRFNYRFNLPR